MKLLKPVEKIYHLAVGAKNCLYDLKLVKPLALGVPLISVGNLSFGGAGKTPCIVVLAEEFSKKFKINVIAKSYKAAAKVPEKVNLERIAAPLFYGDEACLLQRKLQNCSVWSGPVKADTALASLTENPTLLLLDDGFSHRKLMRNFDLLLVDATEGLSDYLREPVRNLRRAHAVLITKSNLVSSEKVRQLKADIITAAPSLEDSVYLATSDSELAVEESAPLFIFCGLAKPQSVVLSGRTVVHREIFPDHYGYGEKAELKILQTFADLQVRHRNLKLVCTEKDFVKLSNPQLLTAVNVIGHKMEISGKEALFEKIRLSL